MESPVVQFSYIITASILELSWLVNKASFDEKIQYFDLYGGLTRQHCIAKDGIRPIKKEVEAMTEHYGDVTHEQTARDGAIELNSSDSDEDKEQHFWIQKNMKQTPPAAPEASNETTPIQWDRTTIMDPLFSGDARDNSRFELLRIDGSSTKQEQDLEGASANVVPRRSRIPRRSFMRTTGPPSRQPRVQGARKADGHWGTGMLLTDTAKQLLTRDQVENPLASWFFFRFSSSKKKTDNKGKRT